MQRAILECGLVPFFENPIAGYSVEEMTHPSYWFDGDAGVLGPWDWKIDCVQSGDILYGKYLCGGKAAGCYVYFAGKLVFLAARVPFVFLLNLVLCNRRL